MTAARRRPAAEAHAPDLGCACASARRLARTLTQLYDRKLRQADIEAGQFALLMTLQGGPRTQVALGRIHALDKATVSRNLQVLVRRGWVAPVDSKDRRERQVALTPAGRERVGRARVEWQQAQADLQAALSGPEWRAMFATFRAVNRATHGLLTTADE